MSDITQETWFLIGTTASWFLQYLVWLFINRQSDRILAEIDGAIDDLYGVKSEIDRAVVEVLKLQAEVLHGVQ